MPIDMHHVRMGAGKPILLVHGLGGTWRSWAPILDALANEREVIAIDLPGFGDTPPLAGEATFDRLADAVVDFLTDRDLIGIDVVGSSMGARLVLELARRGVVGSVVALNPGGFWEGWERVFFGTTIGLSITLVRLLQPVMRLFTGNPVGRTVLLSQLSARPWMLSPVVTLDEMRSYASSPSFGPLLRNLVASPMQEGVPRGRLQAPMVIAWGRHDRVCLPRQAARANARFPDARLYWFENSGHFPMWDTPAETVRLILDSTGNEASRDRGRTGEEG